MPFEVVAACAQRYRKRRLTNRNVRAPDVLEHYYRELLSFLVRRVGNRDLAADLAQESYARVYSAANGRPVAEPRALLYTTARHLIIDHHRRSLVRGAGLHDAQVEVSKLSDELAGPPSDQPDTVLDGRQRLMAVEKTLLALPPRPREAFVLCKIDGLSRPEVARIMGIGVKTVESHLEVAMRACHNALRERNPPDAPGVDGRDQ